MIGKIPQKRDFFVAFFAKKKRKKKISPNHLTKARFGDTMGQYKEEKRSAFTVRQCLYGQ